jgi:hypothetical protein
MAEALSAAVQIAKYIVAAVGQMRAYDEGIKALAAHVKALQPLLESLLASSVEASHGVTKMLLASLRRARDLVDRVAAMRGAVERFIRSSDINDELLSVRQGLSDSLQSLQAVAVDAAGSMSASLSRLQQRLSSANGR